MASHFQMECFQREYDVGKQETNPTQQTEKIHEQQRFHCGFHQGPGESTKKKGEDHQAGAENRSDQKADGNSQETSPPYDNTELIKITGLFMRWGGMISFQIFDQSPGPVDGPTKPVGHREEKESHRGNQDHW